MDQLEPGSTAYQVSLAARLRGQLDPDVLARALETIVARHQALRTSFPLVDGRAVQNIAPSGQIAFSLVDLRVLPDGERAAAADRHISEASRTAFDLARGPLFRTLLVRLGEAEHLLLLTLHHIVGDAWSLSVLCRELGAVYGAFAQGRASPLAELPIQYPDYAVWQRQRWRGPLLERELAYWRERLAGAPPALDLPTDHPRPGVQNYVRAEERSRLSRELIEGIAALDREAGGTSFLTLMAALVAVLARHSGQQDLVMGLPVAGRTLPETAGLVGCFINSLPLRTVCSGDPTFRELLGRAREAAEQARAHQLPFEKLVEELQPERDLSRTPIFQVFLDVDTTPFHSLDLPGVEVEPVPLHEDGGRKFDLSLSTRERKGDLELALVYDSSLFEKATAAQLLRRLHTLLEGAVADPDRRLSALPLLTPSERSQHSAQVNRVRPAGETRPFPREAIEQSIWQRFVDQVKLGPDHPAVLARDHVWTYDQLYRRAARVGSAVAAAAGAPGGRVALLLAHDAPMIAAMLGVLRAGHAYVPLDPWAPPERWERQLAHAGCRIILADESNLPKAASLGDGAIRVLALEELIDPGATDLAGGLPLEADPPVAPDALAYLLYTSGTTGEPKAVVQNHRNVLHWIRAYSTALRLSPADRLTLLSTYGFDAAVMDTYGALLNGCTLCPLDLRAGDPALVTAEIRRLNATVYHSTPTVFRYLTANLTNDERLASSVRLVVLGGEEATQQDVALYRAHCAPECQLVNGLGPTEATLALQYVMDQQTPLERHSVPVGYPVDGAEILLVDADGHDAEVYGEIAVRSAFVAVGYWGQPELTARAFRPDPLGGARRTYLTGDLGRLLPDGTIEYRGRKDRQLKLRGYRVEPGEVETALALHPSVAECVVVVRTDPPWGPRLVAYAVPAAGFSGSASALGPGELRSHLQARLPEYMVPQVYVVLERLPRLPNGKVSRAQLPSPADFSDNPEEAYVPPRTAAEEQLAAIWAEVLHRDRIGVHDDFFALGGHSLLAAQVVSRLRQTFSIDLSLRVLFEEPTVAGLAGRIQAVQQKVLPVDNRPDEPLDRVGVPPIVRRVAGAPAPLSFAQSAIWFFAQLAPESDAYNLARVSRWVGHLEVSTLERCLTEVVRRHEVLRTRFPGVDGTAIQDIAPAGAFHLAVVDLTAAPERERNEAARRWMVGDLHRPFQLDVGPLLRATLLRLAADEHLLVLVAHHIITDGWSNRILLRELTALYSAFVSGQPSPLAELPVQYGDYALWQLERLQDPALEQEVAYWRDRLSGAPAVLELPTDRPYPAVRSYRGAQLSLLFPADLDDALTALSRREKVTPFITLLAALKALLWRYTQQEDLVVGVSFAGRTRAETEGLIGCFINSLVLRTDCSGDPSFRELLGRVRETALGAYAHQELPFEKLVQELRPERDPRHHPVFQVMFNFQDYPLKSTALPELRVEHVEVEQHTALVDLEILIERQADGLICNVIYNTDIFDRVTAERLATQYRALLDGIATDPERRLSELPLETQEAQTARLLAELEALSEEEVQRLLMGEVAKPAGADDSGTAGPSAPRREA